MQKTDARTFREIERLFERFKQEVDDSAFTPTTKWNCKTGAYYSLRWVEGPYTPGHGLQR